MNDALLENGIVMPSYTFRGESELFDDEQEYDEEEMEEEE